MMHCILALNTKTMQTKTRSKPLIGITALSLLVGLSLASNSEVKNDLSHAVQSIHQVIFTSNTKPENQKTVELKADGSQVQIQGKVLNTSAGMGNSLSQNSQNSQLYYGKKNSIAGSNSAILYGRNNTIKGNQNAIIGGYKNKI